MTINYNVCVTMNILDPINIINNLDSVINCVLIFGQVLGDQY